MSADDTTPDPVPPKLTPWERVKKFAAGWGGVVSVLSVVVIAVVFQISLSNKVDGLKSEIAKLTSPDGGVDSKFAEVRKSIDSRADALNARIDAANARIDHLLEERRASTPLGRAIPTPDVARSIPPDQLRARFQQASYIINSDLLKQKAEKPEVVKQIRNDVAATLKDVPLPPDVHQAGVVALAHVQGYVVFCDRAFTDSLRAKIILPEGNMMLAGEGEHPPELRIGALWNVGKGEDKTAFFIAPSFPPPSVFFADAPSVMTDLSILSFNWPRDLDALTLRGDKASALFFHVRIRGLNQNLAKITWLSVTFQNCVVRYHGEPVYLVDVRFQNCKFDFGGDPTSQKVLAEIKSQENNPVSLVAGVQ